MEDIMATTTDFIEYVLDQARGPWELRYRKMFGEYMVYVNEKPILLVCDNTVFVKMLPELKPLMEDAETGFPYEGAKEHWVLNIDNSRFTAEAIAVLEPLTPLPKPKKPKQAKTASNP
jgi:TfoX/Sxy family transcriptional regulator of competence genes